MIEIAMDPAAEAARIAALERYDILDSHAEEAFDAITRSAAAICGVPIALISLVDSNRQWFKSAFGLADVAETTRDVAFCAHTIQGTDLLEVPDAQKDHRFRDNPLVTGDPNIRFYAGAPLTTPDGFRLGSLCVIDRMPQHLTEAQRAALVELSKVVVHMLATRKADLDAAMRLNKIIAIQARLSEAELDLDGFLEIVLNQLSIITLATGASLEIIDDTDMVCPAASGAAAPFVGERFQRDGSFSAICIESRKILVSDDCLNDPRIHRARCERAGARSMMAAPLFRGGEVFGLLKLIAAEPGAFTRPDVQALELMAGMMSTAFAQRLRFETNQTLLAERTAALRDLAESEERFRTAMTHATIGMGLVSPTGRLLQVNDAMCRFIGYSAEELVGMNFQALTHPDDLENNLELVRRVLRGEIANYQMEKRYFHKDGSAVWALLSASLVRDTDGNPKYFISQVSDIDARKKAEAIADLAAKRLMETNRFLNKAEEVAHIGHWRLIVATREVFWSDEIYRIHQWPVGIPVSLTAAIDAFHPDDRDRVATLVNTAIEQGSAYSFELRMIRPDGSLRHVTSQGRCTIGPDGRTTEVFGTFQDVTEAKEAERQLRERERDFSNILQNTPAMIAYWGADLTNRFANQAHADWFGDTPAVGQHLDSWIKEDFDHVRVHGALAGIMQSFENTITRPDGGLGHVAFRYVPDLENDRVNGFFLLGTDITERKLAENALAESEIRLAAEKERAERANHAKSDFLASMSHELRTPLNAVIGFSQLLLLNQPGNLDPSQIEFASYIQSGGEHLLRLVNDVLELAAIESNRLKLSIGRVACTELFSRVRQLTAPMAAKADIALDFIGLDAPDVRADELRLCQCIVNFVSNAIKYNRRGGSVLVSAARIPGAFVRFTVVDTGIGIASEKQALLFEPFQRLGAELTAIEGTGIGLSLVKRYVKEFGGETGFKSAMGEGSSFWIDLPMESDTSNSPSIVQTIEPARSGSASGGYTVLYVEDNPSNMRLMEHLLSTEPGAAMLAASSARQGLELAVAHRPEVIVLDLNLPDLDGYQILAKLKAMPETKHIPVLALTAAAMAGDMQRGLNAGFFEYMTKPMDVRAVLDALERARFSEKTAAAA